MAQSVTSTILSLQGAVSSLVGGRPENQDDLGWADTPLGFLLVVCDGMGGGPGGKTASYLAKTAFMQAVFESPVQANRREVLQKAVARAEDALEQKMTEVPTLRGMGSTLVAILASQESALIVHLGDSRCYRLHGNQVLFRTQDHSLVGELVQNKALTEEQARVSPQANVITRGLGSTSNHVAEIDEIPYRKGDRFVLCTDGVWGIMPHQGLLQRLGIAMDTTYAVDNLQAEVDRIGSSEGGHHDNHTLAIIEMETDSLLKDKMSKQFKIILALLSSVLLFSIILNIVVFSKMSKMPTSAEFDQIQTLLVEKEQLLSAYEHAFNSTEAERILQSETFRMENEKLKRQVAEQQKYIDSLEQARVDASAQTTSSKSETAPVEQQQNPKMQFSEPIEPRKLADEIINRYDDLRKVKEKDIPSAVKRVKEIRDDIAQKLDELGKYSANTRRTNNIKNDLPTDNAISKSIEKDQKGRSYYPNSYLLREFNTSLKKLKDMRSQLK